MHVLLSMLPILLTGVIVLMAGIIISRKPGQSRSCAFIESLVWGGGFFIALSIEILTFANG
ncbi:MAG TPA: hypothetical protein VFW59_12075 [Gallionella sp.]|nr:hypothetical protein [Gallionella sp.]